MPFDQVMSKFKAGSLHSGGPKGPAVKDRKQAIAIMMSEKKKAGQGKTEYQSKSKDPKEPDADDKPKKKKRGFASLPGSRGK